MAYIKEYFEKLSKVLSSIDSNEILNVIRILKKARDNGNNIFTMGNGGSASTASHFVNGLSQGATVKNEPRFKAIALTDNIPNLLAYANDIGYENIFVEQLKNLLENNDIVIGISGSGNSKNIIKAIHYANRHHAVTIGFFGFDGGELKKIVRYPIYVKCNEMEIVEDIHLSITHLISTYFRKNRLSK